MRYNPTLFFGLCELHLISPTASLLPEHPTFPPSCRQVSCSSGHPHAHDKCSSTSTCRQVSRHLPPPPPPPPPLFSSSCWGGQTVITTCLRTCLVLREEHLTDSRPAQDPERRNVVVISKINHSQNRSLTCNRCTRMYKMLQ